VATRRRYTAKQRAEVAGIALVEGVTEAGRQTGVPKQTIDYWLSKPEFGQLRTTARDVVADQFWIGIQVGLREVVKGIQDPDVPLKDKHAALGTIYDRFALLSGMATARSESRDLTGTLSDADVIAAIAEADTVASTGGTAPEDPQPAEG
jgi:hypothetical protein